ncbi:MAG: YebC/PmpR family DNA-binding transcriptional regulator, partial [Planctomycetota bacterium]
KAREANMPLDNVERAIKKGAGETDGVRLENVIYEGFGPAGVAIMLDALTDNRNRTVSEIRKIFETRGGTLGGSNSVNWLFERKGLITLPAGKTSEDEMIAVAIEVSADDATLSDDIFEITCPPEQLVHIKKDLITKGFTPKTAEISFIPKNYVTLSGETAKKVLELVESLEDHDDVQNVYANFDIQN